MTRTRTDRRPAGPRARRALAALALAGAPPLLAPAAADVTVAEYEDAWHFSYRVQWMPDLDQRRVGLPGSGSMYCVPTASMNMLAYAAQWGFPDVPPGPGQWTGYDDYYEMTANIEDLGALMGTSADGGTGQNGWFDGLTDWTAGHPLIVCKFYRSDAWWPELPNLAHTAACGGLVSFTYGRYEYVDPGNGQPLLLTDRVGGHAVTMVRAVADGGPDYELWTRDPADDAPVDVFSQSPFASRVYDDVAKQDVRWDVDEDGTFEGDELFEATSINHPVGDGRIRLIDKYVAVFPAFGYDFTHVELNFEGLAGGGFVAAPPSIPAPAGTVFEHVELVPTLDALVGVVADSAGGRSICTVSRRNGSIVLYDAEPGIRATACDRYGHLYTLAPGLVRARRCADPSTVVRTAPVTADPQRLAIDHERDRLWAIDGQSGMLLGYDLRLGRALLLDDVRPLGPDFPNGPVLDATVGHDGTIWCLVEPAGATRMLVGLIVLPSGEIEVERLVHPSIPDPEGVERDDAGYLLVQQDGAIKAFRRSGEGPMILVPVLMYDDVVIDGRMVIPLGLTNYDPGVHEGPDWEDTDPLDLESLGPVVRDCPGDLDGDGLVGFGDLVILLAAWGTESASADLDPFDGESIVGLDDLVELLAAWGPCPTP